MPTKATADLPAYPEVTRPISSRIYRTTFAWFDRDVDYVYQPPIEAGDVLIFTEALIHGTAVWRANHERRALLYKYSPPHSRWGHDVYEPSDYPTATPQQLRLMAPPSVHAHPASSSADRGKVALQRTRWRGFLKPDCVIVRTSRTCCA